VIDPYTKKKKIRVNPKLTDVLLQNAVVKTRKFIVNLYVTCESDYVNGVKLYEAIVQSKILSTSESQVVNVEKKTEAILKSVNKLTGPVNETSPLASSNTLSNPTQINNPLLNPLPSSNPLPNPNQNNNPLSNPLPNPTQNNNPLSNPLPNPIPLSNPLPNPTHAPQIQKTLTPEPGPFVLKNMDYQPKPGLGDENMLIKQPIGSLPPQQSIPLPAQ
jgi:hypothetical protein